MTLQPAELIICEITCFVLHSNGCTGKGSGVVLKDKLNTVLSIERNKIKILLRSQRKYVII